MVIFMILFTFNRLVLRKAQTNEVY